MTKVPLGAVSQRLPKYAKALGRELQAAVHRETARTAFSLIAPEAPVGSYPQTSPHPGKLRASILLASGKPRYANLPDRSSYPIPGDEAAETGLRRHKPGQGIYLTYRAKSDRAKDDGGYAASIEAGLRTKNGRTYGSKQAPKGWVGPGIDKLPGHYPEIFERAVADFKARVKP